MLELLLIGNLLGVLILIGLHFRSRTQAINSEQLNISLLQNNQVFLESFHKNSQDVLERLGQNSEKQQKSLYEFRDLITGSLQKDFEKLNQQVEGRLDKISQKVQDNLNQGFEKTNKTFADLMGRLAKIDEAQKKIEELSTDVVSLQDVLTDKKSRGIFGEVQLKHLLETVFGENHQKVFSLQYTLSNQKMADAILRLPEPVGIVCVDSKFPLENFKRMLDKNFSESERQQFTKDFARDVKKHIDAIASKYIIKNETSDQAIMFLPAEAIFAELHAYHADVIDYAHKNRVWISSPTTFMATLTSLQTMMLNLERNKYMGLMHEEINRLGKDFERFSERWDNLSKHIGTVQKDVDDIHISSKKITGHFKRIMDVEIKQLGGEHES